MIYSAALTTEVHEQLVEHLLREDDQEDLCFALYRPSSGRARKTGIVSVVLTPVGGQTRVSDGNADEGSPRDAGSNTKLPARIQTRSRPPCPILAK